MESAKNPKLWEGVYQSFPDAAADYSVFEGEVWLKKCIDRARAALFSSRGPAAIPEIAETRDYALPYVAALLARPEEPLRVLDFGGGLGASYLPLVKMLPQNQPIEFVVVENETLCAHGRKLFSGDARIRFHAELPIGEKFQIVHCGSSLHYVDDWKAVIGRLVQYAPEYLLLADLPAADNVTFVTAQLFHGSRIPVRFWNVNELVAYITGLGYMLAMKARYRNPNFGADAGVATNHFDPAHRLGYFAQLIFRISSRP